MAQFLSTDELDFETLKANLKTFLKSQDLFKDYDFEGSNLAVLIDLLTYNTYQNAFYLNQLGTEMFLDTALLKESVSSHAKELNYIPRARGSSAAVVNLSVTGDAAKGTKTIPEYTTFTSVVGANTLTFSTDSDIVAVNDGTGTFVANNVSIYEGTLVTEFFEEDGTQNKFVLASANVDINSIDATVQTSASDISNTSYSRATNLFNLTPTSTVFFVQPFGTNKYEIEFGNDITGKSLDVGNILRVRYRDSIASAGDNATTFTATDPTITPTTVTKSTGGSERESIASIKFNAPRVFATQDRAVTTEDYKSIIKTQFPYVQTLNVIGGEDLDPPRFGKVQIVAKPFGGTVLSQSQKDSIVSYLKDKTSVTSEVITGDGDFINIIINTTVQYNSTQTTKTAEQIRTLIVSAITDYNDLELSEFDKDFRYSQLTTDIDGVDTSVISNNTKVSIAKRITPLEGNFDNLSIDFGQRLRNELDYGVSALYSTKFLRTINSTSFEVYLKAREVGSSVQTAIVDLVSDINGLPTTKVANIGTIDYSTGMLTLTNFVVTNYFTRGTDAYGDHINIIARPYDQDIVAENDQILEINSQDISVSVVARLTDD